MESLISRALFFFFYLFLSSQRRTYDIHIHKLFFFFVILASLFDSHAPRGFGGRFVCSWSPIRLCVSGVHDEWRTVSYVVYTVCAPHPTTPRFAGGVTKTKNWTKSEPVVLTGRGRRGVFLGRRKIFEWRGIAERRVLAALTHGEFYEITNLFGGQA